MTFSCWQNPPGWTHASCDACWDMRNPDRRAVPRANMAVSEDACCYCGGPSYGIYDRADPAEVHPVTTAPPQTSDCECDSVGMCDRHQRIADLTADVQEVPSIEAMWERYNTLGAGRGELEAAIRADERARIENDREQMIAEAVEEVTARVMARQIAQPETLTGEISQTPGSLKGAPQDSPTEAEARRAVELSAARYGSPLMKHTASAEVHRALDAYRDAVRGEAQERITTLQVIRDAYRDAAATVDADFAAYRARFDPIIEEAEARIAALEAGLDGALTALEVAIPLVWRGTVRARLTDEVAPLRALLASPDAGETESDRLLAEAIEARNARAKQAFDAGETRKEE